MKIFIYKVKEENITSPAIIVTGEAAAYDFRVSKMIAYIVLWERESV